MFSNSVIALSILIAVSAAPLSRRAVDFGSCSDPTIKFANGLDGRNQPAFAPNNDADFNHGSALNIGVIASFICDRLHSPCDASQDAIDACNAAGQAAAALTGQAAADAFNKAITGGAASVSSSSSVATTAPPVASATAAASTDDCVATVTVTVVASTAAAATATSTATAAAAPPNSTSASGTSTSTSSSNLQTFTGNLGGLPPPVTAGGKGFITDGSEFLNLAAALGRSCDVQHNACADASNSGAGSFKVSDCDAQDTACKSAAN